MNDKGRDHSQRVLEGLGSCPETRFEEVRPIGNGKSASRKRVVSKVRLSSFLDSCLRPNEVAPQALFGSPPRKNLTGHSTSVFTGDSTGSRRDPGQGIRKQSKSRYFNAVLQSVEKIPNHSALNRTLYRFPAIFSAKTLGFSTMLYRSAARKRRTRCYSLKERQKVCP